MFAYRMFYQNFNKNGKKIHNPKIGNEIGLSDTNGINACGDPESFVRGDLTLTFCFNLMRGGRIQRPL